MCALCLPRLVLPQSSLFSGCASVPLRIPTPFFLSKTQGRKKNDPMEDSREAAPSLIGFCPVLELEGLC